MLSESCGAELLLFITPSVSQYFIPVTFQHQQDDRMTEVQGSRRSHYNPSRFEIAMFWSLLPAVVILPVCLVAGRTIIGGPGGWGIIVLVFTWAPVLFLYHILLLAITVIKNRRRWKHLKLSSSSSRDKGMQLADYFIAEQSASVLTLYYVVSVLVQCFMKDGNEHGSVPSIMTQWLGMSERLCSDIGWLLFSASVALAVELLFLAIVEPLPGEPQLALLKTTKVTVASVILASQSVLSNSSTRWSGKEISSRPLLASQTVGLPAQVTK
jgi:hypothetical protein